MSNRFRIVMKGLLIGLLLIGVAAVANGQEGDSESLSLRFRRKFGYGLGAQMQGTFALRVEGPKDLTRVEFLLDGEVIGTDDEAPFSIDFNTRAYSEGVHKFSAVGYTDDERQLQTETISRQFVATSYVTIFVIAIVALVIAFRAGSYFLARRSGGDRGKSAAYGFLGGTVCPNCGRPFGVHWWSLRLGVGRYDRCPHCGKWNMVQRASAEALGAAEERLGADADADSAGDAQSEEKAQRRRIEESRYDRG